MLFHYTHSSLSVDLATGILSPNVISVLDTVIAKSMLTAPIFKTEDHTLMPVNGNS